MCWYCSQIEFMLQCCLEDVKFWTASFLVQNQIGGGRGHCIIFQMFWMLRLILFSIVCSEWAAVSFFKFWTDFSNKYVLHNNAYGGIKTISNFFGINCGNLPPFTVAISWFLYWFYQGSSPCLKYTVCSCCWQQRASQLQLLLALTGLLEKKMLWF